MDYNSKRSISIRVKADNDLHLFNIYAPCNNAETKEFPIKLKQAVSRSEAETKIVCGDFNAVLSNELDIISGNPNNSSLVDAFNDFMNECDLCDVWRFLIPIRKTTPGQEKQITARQQED